MMKLNRSYFNVVIGLPDDLRYLTDYEVPVYSVNGNISNDDNKSKDQVFRKLSYSERTKERKYKSSIKNIKDVSYYTFICDADNSYIMAAIDAAVKNVDISVYNKGEFCRIST